MPNKHMRLLHGVEVPDADFVVEAAAIHGVVSHRERVDFGARCEGEDALHRFQVPHLTRPKRAGTGAGTGAGTAQVACLQDPWYLDGIVLGCRGEHVLFCGKSADP